VGVKLLWSFKGLKNPEALWSLQAFEALQVSGSFSSLENFEALLIMD
jgi:hypothetical protein